MIRAEGKKIRMMLTIVAATILAVCMFWLCACQSNQNSDGKLSVTDYAGRTLTFDGPISKVVSTHNPTLNHVVVLGNGTSKYLAGFGNKDKANGLYSRVLSDWNNLTQIGGQGNPINKETIIQLHPDLALVPENLSKMAEDDWDGTGVNYFVCMPEKESFNTVTESLQLISKLFGEEKRAQTVTDKYNEIMNTATNAVKNASNKPKVLFMGSKQYKVATSDMIQTQLIEAAGGENAAAGQFESGFFAETDAESIVKMNPDVIWFPNYAKFSVDDLLNDPKLQSVTAIKNKKVYKFPCNLEPWDYPTCSVCLGAAWGAYNLHPDLFTKDQLLNKCNEFYKLLYNKTFTAEELGIS